jgi:hypothetical protein
MLCRISGQTAQRFLCESTSGPLFVDMYISRYICKNRGRGRKFQTHLVKCTQRSSV